METLTKTLNFFDIERFFVARYAAIRTNRPEWIRINCPRHDDNKRHLYINVEDYFFNCFRCGFAGQLAFLFYELLNLPLNEHKLVEFLKETAYYSTTQLRTYEEKEGVKDTKEIGYPEFSVKLWSVDKNDKHYQKALRYLTKRNFTEHHILKYRLGYCYFGAYVHRIIIPVYYKYRIISYVMRSINDSSERRYLNYENRPVNDYIYNYDCIVPNKPLVICEGCFDSWRLQEVNQTVALFKKKISQNQITKLLTLGPKEVIVCLDSEAWLDALALGRILEPYFSVSLMRLEKGDPADSTVDVLWQAFETKKPVSDCLLEV